LSEYAIDTSRVSIGQATDTNEHYEKYQLWSKETPNSSCILWGVSRGAATTFCSMAKHQYQDVKLVILEGCFGKMEKVFTSLLSHYPAKLVHRLVPLYYKAFDHTSKQEPLDLVDQFPPNIPVVFITSKKDEVVPCENTIELAHALAARGKNDVYLYVLESSYHSEYSIKTEKYKYFDFIHAIYRHYNLDYIDVISPNYDISQYRLWI
jgi:hypothetical protein